MRRDALHNDAWYLDKTIGGRIRDEVFAIARKALADLAGTSLEERLCEVFVRRLQEMDEQTRAGLADALRTSTDPALVRSAFELPAEQRATLQATLERIFPAGVRVRFETVPELVGGIELSASGRKLAWSIADYLGSLEKSVGELVDLQAAPVRKAP